MKSQSYYLGLDLGTTAIKSVVMDETGRIIADTSKTNCFTEPENGCFEIVPEQHYQDVCSVIRELTAQVPGNITAVAMAAASGNAMLTDQAGKPLTNIISWMDRRAVKNPPKALSGLTVAELRSVTGWPCIDCFPLAQFAWLMENEPELYRNAGRYCMNTDWLLFRLTGKWLMDYSSATTSHLQDQSTLTFCKKFLDILHIPPEKMSGLVPSGCSVGTMTKQALADTGLSETTKVVAGSFDHPAAALAVGVVEPGQLMLSCGTSWVGFFPENDRRKIIDLEMLCDPFLSLQGGAWGAIFSVPYIGRTIDWYVENMIAPGRKDKFAIFDAMAARAETGAGGLKIDLRKPPEEINDTCENISRAVMEGAAKLLNEKIIKLAAKGIKFKSAVMVGGPAKSPIWPQIVEDITGITLSTGSQHAGAKGAAILAGKGCADGY
jgi:sugar (pentulose or hexulose) kinase